MTHAYPLAWPEGWPRTPPSKQRKSRFVTSFDRARRGLVNELRKAGARNVVLSSNVPLRNDGQPYADWGRRRIDDPGVAVYFVLNGRQMAMAHDRYWSVGENIRGLGLAIEHLRGLERHGGAPMIERAFGGFTALPPPRSCWEILGLAPGSKPSDVEARFRKLALQRHPDRGGSDASMAELNEAREAALAACSPR